MRQCSEQSGADHRREPIETDSLSGRRQHNKVWACDWRQQYAREGISSRDVGVQELVS